MSISLNKFNAVLTIAKLFNKEDKLTHCIEEIDKINSIADVSHYVEEVKKQIINEENKKQNEETNLLCLNLNLLVTQKTFLFLLVLMFLISKN